MQHEQKQCHGLNCSSVEENLRLRYNKDELEQMISEAARAAVNQILVQPQNLDNGIEKNDDEPSCNSIRLTLSVEEAAVALGVSRATAYELAKRRDFPSFRIGNRILVKRAALEQWLEAQPSAAE